VKIDRQFIGEDDRQDRCHQILAGTGLVCTLQI